MATAGQIVAGEVIAGRYRIVRALGSGGMGAVFEAENLRTGRRVALKVIHVDLSAQPEFARRFEREARAAARLKHRHIVDILDLGDDPARGIQFLVQELLEGESLADRLDRAGPLSPRAALDVVIPIADALVAVHAAGLVHRDVKPDNVFLERGDDGETPKLIDFGVVALAAAPHAHRLTHAGTLVGTPAYMAPEQTLSGALLDGRADLWSLGVVLYEALSGHRPYDAADAEAMLVKIRTDPPRPLAAAMPALPAPLVAVVDRSLQKDRTARWPSATAFRDALRQVALRLSAARFDDPMAVTPGRGGADEDEPATTIHAPEDEPATTIHAPEDELTREVARPAAARVGGARPGRGYAFVATALVVAVGVGVGVGVNRAVQPRVLPAASIARVVQTREPVRVDTARAVAPPVRPPSDDVGSSATDVGELRELPAAPTRPRRPARPRRPEYRPRSI